MNEPNVTDLPTTLPALLGCPATYRKFEYHTMVVGDDAECIALLTQVMNSYPNANRIAVASWFLKAYGQAS